MGFLGKIIFSFVVRRGGGNLVSGQRAHEFDVEDNTMMACACRLCSPLTSGLAGKSKRKKKVVGLGQGLETCSENLLWVE